VRTWRDRTERRTPNVQLRAAETNQVRQVRVAAGKLRQLHLGVEAQAGNVAVGEVPSKIGGECGPVEFLAASYLARVTVHGGRLSGTGIRDRGSGIIRLQAASAPADAIRSRGFA